MLSEQPFPGYTRHTHHPTQNLARGALWQTKIPLVTGVTGLDENLRDRVESNIQLVKVGRSPSGYGFVLTNSPTT